jgi:uncharacterized protein
VPKIAVYATPKAARDEIVGWKEGELAVRVRSTPEAGKANNAVCRMIARALGIPPSAVSVVRGAASRHKLLQVQGIDDSDVAEVLGKPSA